MQCTVHSLCIHASLYKVAEDGRHSIRKFNTVLQGVISQKTVIFVCLFLAYLMTLWILISDYVTSSAVFSEYQILKNLENRCAGKNWSILPGGTEEDHDIFNECLCQGRDFNSGPPEYEVVVVNYNVTPLPRKCNQHLRPKYTSLPNLAPRKTDSSSLCCFVKYRQKTWRFMKESCLSCNTNCRYVTG
jgi:hypothetical protein